MWGIRNCNLGDTDLGKTKRVFREEIESGAYKGKSYTAVKVTRTMTDFDTKRTYFIFKG